MKFVGSRSINQDRLAELRDSGHDSVVLLARLAFNEHEGTRKDLAKMVKLERAYPEVLPTQASGRWSTKKPNLGGFTRDFWRQHYRVIKPDPGWWWLEWDWLGIECRMFVAYTGDDEDVAWLIGQNLPAGTSEIHGATCLKYLFAWDALPADWQGSKDERRTRAKNFRYGVGQYGLDERAVLGMPGIEKLGLDRTVLLARARAFLHARPKAQAWKQQIWAECTRSSFGPGVGIARTFMGRRRMLFGDEDARKKDGLNHMIQGSVADLMDWSLGRLLNRELPEAYLVLNKHDGAILSIPESRGQDDTFARCRAVVEREWEVGQGVRMSFPASWTLYTPDGERRELG